MNYTREPFYKTLGAECKAASYIEAIAQTGKCDYTVSKRQLAVEMPTIIQPTPGEIVTPHENIIAPIDAYGTFRDDRLGNEAFFGTVGKDYEILQPEQCFGYLDRIVGENSNAEYVSIGEIGKGERIFAVVDAGEPFEIGNGDEYGFYIVGLTSFNGTQATQYFAYVLREICTNGMRAWIKAAATAFKHTKHSKRRLDKATRHMAAAVNAELSLKERLEFLSTRMMTKESLEDVMKRLFPADQKSERSKTRADNLIMEVIENFENNDGGVFPETKDTAYSLFNAYTEFYDHDRQPRETKTRKGMEPEAMRALSTFDSIRTDPKHKALKIIETAVADNPTRQIQSYPAYVPTPAAAAVTTVELEPDEETPDTGNGGGVLDDILSQF